MSNCNNKRLRSMLGAWELGALNEEERREVDLHILECETCFEEVQQFRREAALLRNDAEVRDIVTRADSVETESHEKIVRRRSWTRIITPLLVAAAVIVALVVQPWRLEFHPGDEAMAEEGRLAIFHFKDLSGSTDSLQLGRIIANLLIIDLSESVSVPVLADVVIQDYLEAFKKGKSEDPDEILASEVARRAGARWMVTGRILAMEPKPQVLSDVVDLKTGHVVASQQVEGKPGDDIFAVADLLAAAIREDLSLPQAAGAVLDRMVAEMTTHSPLAYHHYLNGIDLFNKLYFGEAIVCFDKALAIDSTFALAYYYLSHITEPSLVRQAVRYSAKVARLDRYYINARAAMLDSDSAAYISYLETIVAEFPDQGYAYYLLGSYARNRNDLRMARDYYERAVEVSPRFKPVYNDLAYLYQKLEEPERAIWAADQYLNLAPDEANPYDTRGDIFVQQGLIDSAITAYQMAMLKKPDFHETRTKLADLHLYRGDYSEAERLHREQAMGGDPARIMRSGYDLAIVWLYQGEIETARHILDQSLAYPFGDTLTESIVKAQVSILYRQACIHEELGEYEQAMQSIQDAMAAVRRFKPEDSISYRPTYIKLLLGVGRAVEAKKELDQLRVYGERMTSDLGRTYLLDLATGYFELASNHPREAVHSLERAVERAPEADRFRVLVALVEAYLQAGQTDKATDLLEKQVDGYSQYRLGIPLKNMKLHYYLGLAYEQSNAPERAIIQYQQYTDIWESTELRPLAASDASDRLARLQSQP